MSPGEREIVRLLVEDRTNPRIAEALTLSLRTVSGHVHWGMRTLHVTSRTAAAVGAVELRLAHGQPSVAADE